MERNSIITFIMKLNFNINFPQFRQIVISCSAEDVEVQPTPWELLEKIKAKDIFFNGDCRF